MQGALGSIPGQYSCLENSTDSWAWWATVYGVTKSDTTEHSQNYIPHTASKTWHSQINKYFLKRGKMGGVQMYIDWNQQHRTSGFLRVSPLGQSQTWGTDFMLKD